LNNWKRTFGAEIIIPQNIKLYTKKSSNVSREQSVVALGVKNGTKLASATPTYKNKPVKKEALKLIRKVLNTKGNISNNEIKTKLNNLGITNKKDINDIINRVKNKNNISI